MAPIETPVQTAGRVLLEIVALLLWVFGTASFIAAPGFIRPSGFSEWAQLVILVGLAPILVSAALFALADRRLRSPLRTAAYAVGAWVCLGLIVAVASLVAS